MTLSRRLAVKIGAMLLSLALLFVAALWGLQGLHEKFLSTRDEYSELRMLQAAQVRVTAASLLLQGQQVDPARITHELATALAEVHRYIDFQSTQRGADPDDQRRELRGAHAAEGGINTVLAAMALAATQPERRVDAATAAQRLDRVLGELSSLSVVSDDFVARATEQTTTQVWRAMWLLASLAIVMVVSSVIMNVWLHRSVIRPLRRLQQRVREVASGKFDQKLLEAGGDEFRELAMEFNQMADELSALYKDLEEKVRLKSRELVRSERLASVGYLAAGVAHEINNPLNIISAHAELLLRRLDSQYPARSIEELRSTLEIVRDEAFRCKGITQKLLSLSRGGSEGREYLSASRLIQDVVSMISALPVCRERRLVTRLPESDELVLDANSSELKQVLLNLTVNALEAVPPGTGIVLLEGYRRGDSVELVVRDNGRGMCRETLEKVFEPFFSDRRAGSERGTGLGLSITHAIVQAHGGTIEARSDGVGRGSVFTVRLPACAPEQVGHEGPASTE